MSPNTDIEEDAPVKEFRDTVNPYRFALRVVRDRLRWDLRLHSWRSRSRLRKLRDQHSSGRAVIVCNGPSLNETNLDLLPDVFTFGLNKIHLLFERSAFRPSCITAVNPLVIEQTCEFYNRTDIPLFLDSHAAPLVKARENVIFLHSADQPKFARDCSMSIYQGFTVTFVAMQLAFHMGFRDIALVGCDHNFATKGRANQAIASEAHDTSHFDPRYFSGGQKWNLPDLSGSEYFYTVADAHFSAFGGRIINCTVGGQLELFPRMPLSEWLHGRS